MKKHPYKDYKEDRHKTETCLWILMASRRCGCPERPLIQCEYDPKIIKKDPGDKLIRK